MALTITLQITDEEEAALRHDLLDIEAWVRAMLAGKLNNCRKRMSAEALAKLRDGAIDLKSLADLSHETLADALAKQPYYKDREAREAEEAAGRA